MACAGRGKNSSKTPGRGIRVRDHSNLLPKAGCFSIRRSAACGLAILLAIACCARPLPAAPTPQLRTKLTTGEGLLKKAGRQFTAKKYQEAAETLTQAQKILTELEAEDVQFAAGLRKSITKARDLLGTQGVELPALEPAPVAGKGTAGKPGTDGTVSFTKQVAPILVAKCAKCHIDKSSGDFSMATYGQLAKGSKDGLVYFPGKGKTSRMIELIEQGDMPRGGGSVSPEELALLIKWIDEGAKFDGKDATDRLNGRPAAPDAPKTVIPVVQATGKEEEQFARDVGPVLLANCTGCHGAQNPRGRLGMDTFTRLLAGGESGAAITPGNGPDSLIIKKLRGTGGGNRMPMGKPALPDDVIAKIEKWISSGAKFDGPDPGQTLAEVVALVRAKAATHEELSRQRSDIAVRNWRLTLPDAPPDRAETDHFLLYGNVGVRELEEVGRLAEEQVPKIDKLLKLPGEGPFIKGRLTIYVFQKHYDYGEVGTMLEKREIPTESRGHWRYTIVDAYACVVPPKSGEYSLAALLSQQIAGAYVAAQGQFPHWFAEGAGRAVASKLYPKDALVRQWDERIPSSLGGSKKPDDFLTGGLNPEDSDVLAYSFVKSLSGNPTRFSAMIAAVHSGAPFDQAFAKQFGNSPSQLAMGWASKAGSKRGR
jgi:mono/diheme cytochrome c family protein